MRQVANRHRNNAFAAYKGKGDTDKSTNTMYEYNGTVQVERMEQISSLMIGKFQVYNNVHSVQ
jgi:hypothetical protein